MSKSHPHPDNFVRRHIGPAPLDVEAMLKELGYNNLSSFSDTIIPSSIGASDSLSLPEALSESEAIMKLKSLASENKLFKNYLGHGYYGTITPGVIKRNILENPGWYTQYTPYQAEIAQGRLEALLNFQTMVCDLTGMEIANASLLDEATAAAEAMSMACNALRGRRSTLALSEDINPQTKNVIETRAEPLGLKIVNGTNSINDDTFAILLQYPASSGSIEDYSKIVTQAHSNGSLVIVATDLLSLCLLKPPGEWGADITKIWGSYGFWGPSCSFHGY